MSPDDRLNSAILFASEAAKKVDDIAWLPKPVRTVFLVHAAQGVIDNGGFQYFFESDFLGQPGYETIAQAYREIGADGAAEVIEQAVALFPFENPHKHVKERNDFLDRFLNSEGEVVDSPFESLADRICGKKAVWEKLEAYVRAHPSAFQMK